MADFSTKSVVFLLFYLKVDKEPYYRSFTCANLQKKIGLWLKLCTTTKRLVGVTISVKASRSSDVYVKCNHLIMIPLRGTVFCAVVSILL